MRHKVEGQGGWGKDTSGCGWTGAVDFWRHRALVRGAAFPCSLSGNKIDKDGAAALAGALEKNSTLTSLSCVWEKALGLEGDRGLEGGGHGGRGGKDRIRGGRSVRRDVAGQGG